MQNTGESQKHTEQKKLSIKEDTTVGFFLYEVQERGKTNLWGYKSEKLPHGVGGSTDLKGA